MKYDFLLENIKNIDDINKIIINLSGGLDSTILIYFLKNYFGSNKIHAISFDYEQKHNFIELYQSKKTTSKLNIKHTIIPIPFLGIITRSSSSLIKYGIQTPSYEDIITNSKKLTTYVPFRNLIFSSITLSFAESINANSIALGLQYGDYENKKYEYWDCSPLFLSKLQEIVSLNSKKKMYIFAPFINLKKEDEISIAKELNVPFEDTWTCYNPTIRTFENQKIYIPCDKCPSCVSRKNAFYIKKTIDPLVNGIII